MANVIKPKRSSVGGNNPTTANLASGEMAVNMADQKIWIHNGTSIVQIGSGKLSAIGEVSLSSPANGQVLSYNGTNWINSTPVPYPSAGIPVSTGSAWGTSKSAPTGAIVGDTDTQTLGNKRINPRISSATTITSPLAFNSDNFDQYAATAQAAAFTISADSGTPVDGQKMIIRVVDNGTAQTITFTGGVAKGFQPIGVTLTVSGSNWTYTTTAGKTVYFGCIYNTFDSRWDIIAISLEA